MFWPTTGRRSTRSGRREPVTSSSPALPLLPTTVVGSFPQPEWLVDRAALLAGGVPRVPRPTLWRVPEELREQAHDDAVRLVVRDMERAGVEIVSDGEVRRESYFSWLAPALTGLDVARPGTAMSRVGRPTPVPRAVGPITRPKPVLARHTAFLRAETNRPIKITVPGPFTLTALTQNEYYPDAPSLALAYAAVVNEELRDLKAAGADFVQLDEPYLQAWPRTRVRGDGHRPRAGRDRRADRRASLLRLRAHRTREAERLLIPARAGAMPRHTRLDRGRPATARLRHPALLAVEDRRPGRSRPGRPERRDSGGRGRPHPAGTRVRAAGASGRGTGLRDEVSAARPRRRDRKSVV